VGTGQVAVEIVVGSEFEVLRFSENYCEIRIANQIKYYFPELYVTRRKSK
jgi:hypothetical protein